MEIDIFSIINFQFLNHQFSGIRRTTKNTGSIKSAYPENYISAEIEKIDNYFNTLNSIHFNFEEYLTPLYVHFIEIYTLEKIANNLYSIEKRRNKYLSIEKFKERVLGNLKYQLNYFFNDKEFKTLQWINDDCYYIRERIDVDNRTVLSHQKILIFDKNLSDETLIQDYFDALLKFIDTFKPTETIASTFLKKIPPSKRYFNSFYYSYSNFISNYEEIYKEWLVDHPEGYELKFIEDIYYLSNLRFVKDEVLKGNENFLNLEFIPIFKKNHIIYVALFEFAEFITEKIKNHKKKFNITFTNKDFDYNEVSKNQDRRLELSYEVYELRGGKFDFFDFAGNTYIYSNLCEGNETFIERNTLIDLSSILKPFYLNNDNFEVMIDLSSTINYQHSVIKINDFLQKRISFLNKTNNQFEHKFNFENINKGTHNPFKESDYNKENLTFNITHYFDLLNEIKNLLCPIQSKKDLEFVVKNSKQIFNLDEILKLANIERYFVLYNQIQDRKDRLPFIKNIYSYFSQIKTSWEFYYNDEVFKGAKDFNLFWNESIFKNLIYQISNTIKSIDDFLVIIKNDLENESNGYNKQMRNHIPEQNFTEPETIEQTKIKVEMIVLKELGIIDLFKKSQKLTNSETARRIVYILNDKLKNANTKNPQNYIENILTAIANGTPEINTDKTPYKKQNIKDALISLNSMGLSIDDTTYLKVLKNTHPNLFE
ncbi:MAG: hypothetical protein KJ689_12450 [Bacteroidetes bacterium]|nr:hypothetical protein [Bacteroidota bacterium]